MFRNHQRIYFYHLKKCAGTSLIRWLELFVADHAQAPLGLFQPSGTVAASGTGAWSMEQADARASSLCLASFDFVHGHPSGADFAVGGTYRFTVLRSPRQRLLSQIGDWRREAAHADNHGPVAARLMRDAAAMSVRTFLLTYADHPDWGHMLDNYLTRAFLAGTIHADDVQSERLTGRRVSQARARLRDSFDFVGLSEDMAGVQSILAHDLHRIHPPAPRHENVSGSARLADEAEEAAAEITRLCARDEEIYAEACSLYRRHATRAGIWDEQAFEREALPAALGGQRAEPDGGWARYGVRGPLVGHGVHGRDSPGTDQCRVWTGPETRTVLYLPCPADMWLEVGVWIHGYADPAIRAGLRLRVDGAPVAHRFVPTPRADEMVVARVRTLRTWLRIEIEVPFTIDYPLDASGAVDTRHRGVSFDAVGWQVEGRVSPPRAHRRHRPGGSGPA